jgi:hypothetical protein
MFIVNRNSWHYKMVQHFYQQIDVRSSRTFCEYVSYVVSSTILFVLFTAAISTVGILNLLGIYAAITGVWVLGSVFGLINLATVIALSAGGITFLFLQWYWSDSRIARLNAKSSTPGFFASWYDSVKNKVCIPVKFE